MMRKHSLGTRLKNAKRLGRLLKKVKVWRHPVSRNIEGLMNYVFGKPGSPASVIQPDISRLCTFQCDYCLVHTDKPEGSSLPVISKRTPQMSYKLFQKIVDDHPEAIVMQLQGQGEPTLHKQFDEMVKYARDAGKFVYTISNGQSPNSEVYRRNVSRGIDAGLDMLLFSVDIGSADYNESRRKGMVYDEVLSNMEFCADEVRDENKNTIIGVSATVSPKNLEELSKSVDRSIAAGAEFILISPLVTTENYLKEGIYSENDFFSLEELHFLEVAIRHLADKKDIPAYTSFNLCASGQTCNLMRSSYIIPDGCGSYSKTICQNLHTGGPRLKSEEYDAEMIDLDTRIKKYAAGESSGETLSHCKGCIVPEIMRYKNAR